VAFDLPSHLEDLYGIVVNDATCHHSRCNSLLVAAIAGVNFFYFLESIKKLKQ